jgi:hypothetical protein
VIEGLGPKLNMHLNGLQMAMLNDQLLNDQLKETSLIYENLCYVNPVYRLAITTGNLILKVHYQNKVLIEQNRQIDEIKIKSKENINEELRIEFKDL